MFCNAQYTEGNHNQESVSRAANKYADNMELSQARAYSVYKFLVKNKHMSEDSLECSGRGEQEPIATNDTKEGRALNRRVEIRIYSVLTNN